LPNAEEQEARTSEAAERYAAAAFDLAEQAKALDAVEKDLASFVEAWDVSADLRATAASPLVAPEEKARALVAVAARLGLSKLGRNLIGVAATNGRADEIPAIAAAYRRLVALKRGQREVEIISATPIDQDNLKKLTEALSKALGQQIHPTTRVDERLIGGFVVRAGSRQFDSSVRTKLDSLKLALKAK
jgi:F-type H+-transporting ATPase subunit delta